MVASVSDCACTRTLPWPRWLVQAFGIAAAFHQAAGELIDDDHLIIADD